MSFDYSPFRAPFSYNFDGQYIEDRDNHIVLDIRGWGYLTGNGSEALKMEEEAAAKIQDAIGKHVTSIMNGESVTAITDIRNKLSRRFPRLTFAVSQTAWRHGGACIESYVEYVISVQPGFNGCDSQNFSDNSLEKCLKKFNAVAGT